MLKRIICDIVLFASLFFMAWYWTAVLAVVFIILFKKYWEGAVAGFFLDAIYSVSTTQFYAHFGVFTIIFLILILIIEGVRPRLRFI